MAELRDKRLSGGSIAGAGEDERLQRGIPASVRR
jgi:hypothetical protein